MRRLVPSLLAGLISFPALAITLVGTVTGPDNQPVANATVWLYRAQWQPQHVFTLIATGRTAADGSFALSDPGGPLAADSWFAVYAWKQGSPAVNQGMSRSDKPFALRLAQPEVLQGSVVAPDMAPLAGIRLSPTGFGRETNGYTLWSADARAVLNATSVVTDERGEFSLPVPKGTGEVGLEASAPGYGAVGISFNARVTPLRITLEPAGSLRGKVALAPGMQPLELQVDLASNEQGLVHLYKTYMVRTDKAGGFQLPALTSGEWDVRAMNQPDQPYQVRGQRFTIKPRQETSVELKAEPTVLLQGRLVDRDSGHGAAGVTVLFEQSFLRATAVTDAAGRFGIRSLPGKGTLLVSGSGPLVAIPPSQWMELPAGGLQIPDIQVDVARQLQVVVSANQGPLPRYARVTARQVRDRPEGYTVEGSCNAQGQCTLQRLLGGEATVRAFSGDLASEPVTVRVDDQHEPVKLVLKPGIVATLKVRVRYADGTPYARQYVSLFPHSASDTAQYTDAAGVCETRVLQAGLACHYSVTAPGCPTAQTIDWVTVAGQVHDFGTLTLQPEEGSVAGKVVDQAGKPVAEALVFNGTDGIRNVSVRTDATGGFRLTGLYPGQAFVFVKAKDFRVSGLFLSTGATDVEVVLKTAAPVALGPPLPLPSPPLAPDAARAAAREVLVRALTRPDAALGRERTRLLVLLSRLDAEEAIKLAGSNTNQLSAVRIELGKARLHQDFGQGLALLQAAQNPNAAIRVLLDVAEDPTTTPDTVRQCLQAAQSLLPQVWGLPWRAEYGARLGADMLPLEPEAAKARLQAAVQDIAAAKIDGMSLERNAVEGYLSEWDPAAALAMAAAPPQVETDSRGYDTIARHMARKDPDQALAILSQMKSPYSFIGSLLPFFPPGHFEQARNLALRHGIFNKAGLLIRLCLSAPRERLPGWIEEVRDLLEPVPPEEVGFGPVSGAEREAQAMAALALMARRLGYPEAREIMLRAVLARLRAPFFVPPGDTQTERRHPNAAKHNLQLARVVALMEPKLAARLVPDSVPAEDQAYPLFVQTVAALDPLRAVQLLAAAPVGTEAKDTAYQKAVAGVAEALMLSPQDREEAFLQDRDLHALPLPDDLNNALWY